MYACNEFVSSVAKIIGSCEEILQAVVGGLTYKNDENFGTFQKHLLLKLMKIPMAIVFDLNAL